MSLPPIVYVGIDVGYRTFSAAIPGCKPRDFEHSSTGICALLRWAAGKFPGELRCVCESSGPYSLKLASLLSEQGAACSIVPPQRVRYNAAALGRRSKTDRIDAQVILDYAIHVQPRVWVSPTPEQQQLASLLSVRENLLAELQRWSNRLHALQQLPACAPEVLALHERWIAALAYEHKDLELPVKALIKAGPELLLRFKLLTSIPGVGAEIAYAILVRAEILLSRSPREVSAYAGLAPQHRQSGTSLRGKSRIGRAGDSRLRCLLYMGSLSAAQWNPPLRDFYQRLRARGMESKPAHIAVARKLLLQARSVLRSGQPYVPYLNRTPEED